MSSFETKNFVKPKYAKHYHSGTAIVSASRNALNLIYMPNGAICFFLKKKKLKQTAVKHVRGTNYVLYWFSGLQTAKLVNLMTMCL